MVFWFNCLLECRVSKHWVTPFVFLSFCNTTIGEEGRGEGGQTWPVLFRTQGLLITLKCKKSPFYSPLPILHASGNCGNCCVHRQRRPLATAVRGTLLVWCACEEGVRRVKRALFPCPHFPTQPFVMLLPPRTLVTSAVVITLEMTLIVLVFQVSF